MIINNHAKDPVLIELEELQKAGDDEGYKNKVLEIASQNNRFKPEDFPPHESYGSYGYWLGICNFKTGEYKRARIALIIGIKTMEKETPQFEKYCYLAQGHACLLETTVSSKDLNRLFTLAISSYQKAEEEGLIQGTAGLALTYTEQKNIELAKESILKLLKQESNVKTQSVAAFCALKLNDKEIFYKALVDINIEQASTVPFMLGNIAAGLKRFGDNTNIPQLQKDAVMEALQKQTTKPLKKYGIIEANETGKQKLDMSNLERATIPRIDIEASIGWGPRTIPWKE